MLDNARGRAPATPLGMLCLCLLLGMLAAGLWPFHQPHNDVKWLTNGDGLSLGHHGTLLSRGTFNWCNLAASVSCSLEIRLQPSNIYNTGTLLAFYSSDSLRAFSLRQEEANLVLEVERRDAQHRAVTSEVLVEKVFHQGKPAFVTISSGERGTVVYLDGSSIRALPWVAMDLTGQLVVGTSPVKNDDWSGQLRGLAIYGDEVSGAEVFQHYRAWETRGRPYSTENDRSIALYLFNEHSGDLVRNHGSSGVDLYIPEKYVILHEKFLEPAWKEFSLRWSYWKSALINVAGFVPFGFFFCAHLALTKPINRAAATTVVLGTIVSLTIEVLQAYLPTRDSGTTDLITNTLGTALGVMLYRSKPAIFAEVLNRIPFTARFVRL